MCVLPRQWGKQVIFLMCSALRDSQSDLFKTNLDTSHATEHISVSQSLAGKTAAANKTKQKPVWQDVFGGFSRRFVLEMYKTTLKPVTALTLSQNDILQFLHSLRKACDIPQQGWDVLHLDGRALWTVRWSRRGYSPFSLTSSENPRLEREPWGDRNITQQTRI